MWAQVLVAPRTFEMQEVADLRPEDLAQGEVLVRHLASTICGSDLPYYRGDFSYLQPTVGHYGDAGRPLHEVVGTVVASADGSFEPGTRVVGWAKDQRGFKELFVSDANRLLSVDPGFSNVEATVVQPLACAIYAIDQLDGVSGSRAAVLGQGPLGLLFSYVLKQKGAAEVTGVDTIDRGGIATVFGIDRTVTDSGYNWSHSLADEERPQIVVEAIGHQTTTLNDVVEAVAPGGTIYAFGVPDVTHYPFSFHRFFRKDLTLKVGTTHHHDAYLAKAQEMLLANPELARRYITNVFSAKAPEEAFALASVPARGRLKVAFDIAGA